MLWRKVNQQKDMGSDQQGCDLAAGSKKTSLEMLIFQPCPYLFWAARRMSVNAPG